MNYFENDVAYFIRSGPYLKLMTNAGLSFVRRATEQGRLYSRALANYPHTKCEPLDFHYLCLLNLGALDDLFFEDLLAINWRGIVWAAWLASLRPSNQYRDQLLNLRSKVHERNKTIIDVAVAITDGTQPPHIEEHVRIIKEFSSQISSLPLPKVPLRRMPTDVSQFADVHDVVKTIYRSEGTEAAIRYARTSTSYEYHFEYPAWRKYVARSGDA